MKTKWSGVPTSGSDWTKSAARRESFCVSGKDIGITKGLVKKNKEQDSEVMNIKSNDKYENIGGRRTRRT